jgi:hypothetical protein
VNDQINKTTDKNHNRIRQINEELKAKRGKNQKAQEVLKISICKHLVEEKNITDRPDNSQQRISKEKRDLTS